MPMKLLIYKTTHGLPVAAVAKSCGQKCLSMLKSVVYAVNKTLLQNAACAAT